MFDSACENNRFRPWKETLSRDIMSRCMLLSRYEVSYTLATWNAHNIFNLSASEGYQVYGRKLFSILETE